MDLKLTPVICYWDLDAHKIPPLLQAIKNSGGRFVGAWVPWAHLEKDRYKLLQVFLKQATRFGLTIRLGVSPEVGIQYPNGGVPTDLLSKNEHIAQDCTGQPIYACAPPNIFPLVNLVAPPVFQRYGHFLFRLCQEVEEALDEDIHARIEFVVGDSFFKHYSNLGFDPKDHGDFSSRYFQSELESVRNWKPAKSEYIFRMRALDFLENHFGNRSEVKISHNRFFMRGVSLDRLMDEISGGGMPCEDMFAKMYQARVHSNAVWFEDMMEVSPEEKAFLIRTAITLFSDVWITATDYLACPMELREDISELIQALSQEDFAYDRPVISIVQNRFAPAQISQVLQKKVATALQMHTHLADIDRQEWQQARLLIIEEALALDHKEFLHLLKMARQGVLSITIFRSSLADYSQRYFDSLERFQVHHGWHYEVAMFPSGGNIVVINQIEDSKEDMNSLGDRLLSIANVEQWCEVDRSKVHSITMSWDRKKNKRTLFLFNPAKEDQDMEFRFSKENLEVLGLSLSHNNGTYEGTLPPLSILPLQIQQQEDEHHGSAT